MAFQRLHSRGALLGGLLLLLSMLVAACGNPTPTSGTAPGLPSSPTVPGGPGGGALGGRLPGPFGQERVREMLEAQLASGREAGVQYWPVFESGSGTFVGCCVDLDFYFLECDAVVGVLTDAGLTIKARLERAPYPGHEHPSRRAYLLARKPAG